LAQLEAREAWGAITELKQSRNESKAESEQPAAIGAIGSMGSMGEQLEQFEQLAQLESWGAWGATGGY